MPKTGDPEAVLCIYFSFIINDDFDIPSPAHRFKPFVGRGLVAVRDGDALHVLVVFGLLPQLQEGLFGNYYGSARMPEGRPLVEKWSYKDSHSVVERQSQQVSHHFWEMVSRLYSVPEH